MVIGVARLGVPPPATGGSSAAHERGQRPRATLEGEARTVTDGESARFNGDEQLYAEPVIRGNIRTPLEAVIEAMGGRMTAIPQGRHIDTYV